MVYCHVFVGEPTDRLTIGVKRVITNVVSTYYPKTAELVKIKKIKDLAKYRLIFKGEDEKGLADWLYQTMPRLLDKSVGFKVNPAYVVKR